MADEPTELGDYLLSVRKALGMSQKDVVQRTKGRMTGGYISQVERGIVKRGSPGMLAIFAQVYGINYADLMRLAGWNVPDDDAEAAGSKILPPGVTRDEHTELLEYLGFIRARAERRKRKGKR